MIIYNVTLHIEDSIHQQWLKWIKKHIPQVLSTGKFTEARFTKVLVDDDDEKGTTYSIQYKAISRKHLDDYLNNHADPLKKEGIKKFGDKMLTFRTELEIMDEFTVSFNKP